MNKSSELVSYVNEQVNKTTDIEEASILNAVTEDEEEGRQCPYCTDVVEDAQTALASDPADSAALAAAAGSPLRLG